MPEVVNTSFLGESKQIQDGSQNSVETMIKVDDVSMVFNMASETMNNLKEYAIALVRRELRFKEFRALDHISLEVKKGDVFGILGTNGSGKSTLLKIIAGVLDPSEGTCTVNGSIAPLIELGAGFDMELTARENIYLNGALLGYSKDFIEQHFNEIVDFAEIEKFLDMPLKNYSSGMVARIAFAIATVIVPDILIVDEVLSVGDFMFQKKCEHRINTLIKEHGVTVLIVSHSNEQIERLCNKVIWIEKGHMRMMGAASEVCQVYRTLGGHVGSPEAEQRVYKMLNADISIPKGTVHTISGESKYSTAVKVFEETCNDLNNDTLIIASGDDSPSTILASNMSVIMNYPILLTKRDVLPDIVEQAIRSHNFKRAIIVGDTSAISKSLEDSLSELIPNYPTRLGSIAYHDLALMTYNHCKSHAGRTAVLTYPTCTGDLLSLAPYMASRKTPLFFHVSNGVIDKKTLDTLCNGSFDTVLVLGGQKSFPDSTLEPLQNNKINVIRFCGTTPIDANRLINSWIQDSDVFDTSGAIIASPEDLGDGMALEPFLAKSCHPVIFEDPRDLDSVSNTFDLLGELQPTTLFFVGNNSVFNQLDKTLLAKSITNLSD